ncbi:hypothetical protein, partial [Micrococcus luteus]|uniref:hypothetical protein n=1 Tax=Micrococcus luteus TaxID=1270 RepID=UPI003981591E
PEAFSCSTRSWPEGSPGFFSSIMVMILTVPLGTAYTDHLTRPAAQVDADRRAAVLAWVRDCPSPPTLNSICSAVPGRKQDTTATVRELVEAGQLLTSPGPNRSTLHHLPA